jgi:acetyltransferase-like isoleucine patch superfamily enzyme
MMEGFKRAGRALAMVAALPFVVSFHIRKAIVGPDRAVHGSTQALACVPGLVGVYIRRAFLQRALAFCAPSATVEFGVLFSQAGARIDDRVYIGPRCHVGLVHVERDALIAAGVHIPSGGATHGISDPTTPIRDQSGHCRMVRIGHGCWIGSAAIVMADVGADSVIGAGAVVTHPIPPRAIAAGVPARVIRWREGAHPPSEDRPAGRFL